MGNTLAEIDQGLHIFEEVLPELQIGASIFLPQFAPALQLFTPAFAAVVRAADTISKDGGKPIMDIVQDVVDHLTPGKPNAPALSPSAPPAMSTQS